MSNEFTPPPRPNICIHGGGFTGYTCAVAFASIGHPVLIYDPDGVRVDMINAGHLPVSELVSFLTFDPGYLTWPRYELLHATQEKDAIYDIPNHIFAVPTEFLGRPYMAVSYTHLTLPTTPYV